MSLSARDGEASLAEVAKVAGVSLSTASKALNGRADVRDATRERVQAVARNLGYSPNPVARALGTGQTSTVGVVTSDLDGRFALPILMGVEDALGVDKVLTFLCDARGNEEREGTLLEMLFRHKVDGVVMVGRQNDPRPSLGALPVPVVYAYAESDDPHDCSVSVDNYYIGLLAAEHISSLGRQRIAHISGERGHGAAASRAAGFVDGLKAVGLELHNGPLFGLWTEGWGRAAMGELLDEGTPPDAVFCASDQLARGVIDAVIARGKRVPEDVAVLGVDNWAVFAENAQVPLTTIDPNLEKVGRIAAKRLLKAIKGDLRPGLERVKGSLVHRRSTIPSR